MESTETAPSTRRLLVVDDDRLILKIVRDFFVPRGYRVDEAEDGAQALKRIDEAVPDVVVADVLMPRLDGWELFREVRRRPATSRIPFVFLTTETELKHRLRGLHMGADDYVTKPFHVEELHARVERILLRQTETAAVLAGSVRHMPLSDLLQILSLNGKDGTLTIEEGAESGVIVLVGGGIAHAACGRVSGVKALYRMLGWAGATFRVLPPGGDKGPRTIEAPTTNVLMDGLVSLDEWNRWHRMLPEAGTLLEIAPDAKQRLGSRRLAPAEVDILARAKEGAAVGDVLEQSPFPDADLAEAMCTLLTSGVLCARI